MKKAMSDFSNKRPFRTKLVSNLNSNNSGVNSPLNVANALAFNNSTFPDATSIISLFDEMKIIRGKVHYRFFCGTAGTLSFVPGALAVEFDNTIASITTIPEILTATYHSPVFALCSNSVNQIDTTVRYDTLSFTLPKGTTPIGSSVVTSQWVTIDVTNPPDVCVVEAVVLSAGSGGQMGLSYYVEVDVELRTRT